MSISLCGVSRGVNGKRVEGENNFVANGGGVVERGWRERLTEIVETIHNEWNGMNENILLHS